MISTLPWTPSSESKPICNSTVPLFFTRRSGCANGTVFRTSRQQTTTRLSYRLSQRAIADNLDRRLALVEQVRAPVPHPHSQAAPGRVDDAR